MKINYLLFLILFFVAACNHTIENCDKTNWFKNNSKINLTGGRNELHGYLFCYPNDFRAPHNAHLTQTDTLTAFAPDDTVAIRYYIGNVIPHKNCPETPEEHQKIVAKLDSIIEMGQNQADSPLKNAKLIHFCRNQEDLNALFVAETKTHRILYGVMLSEIPMQGDLQESYMIFQFPKTQFKKYESVIAMMSINFGLFF
ncbi:MAG: hypothetical protein RIS64_2529 [Bacteroidota bacterium]|jgi:hypothetical protein